MRDYYHLLNLVVIVINSWITKQKDKPSNLRHRQFIMYMSGKMGSLLRVRATVVKERPFLMFRPSR